MKLFNNTKIAFSLKSDSELERAFFLFKLIQSQPMVKIGTAATNFALKVNLPVEGLIRSTVFDHFCGGVNEEDCLPVIDKMFEKGDLENLFVDCVEDVRRGRHAGPGATWTEKKSTRKRLDLWSKDALAH